jgi:cation transport regulator
MVWLPMGVCGPSGLRDDGEAKVDMNILDRTESFLVYLKAQQRMGRRAMPYKTVEELPESVRKHLPIHAQEIYMAAFNSSWKEHKHDEERAHRVAWAAVKHSFEKDEQTGRWHAKQPTYP